MNESKKLADALYNREEERLKIMTFHIWIGFLGPRNVYRELKLRPIDEESEFFALYAFKITINGFKFLKYVVAVEVSDGVFVEVDDASKEDLVMFFDRVASKEYPRIILSEEFRKKYGLHMSPVEYEARLINLTVE